MKRILLPTDFSKNAWYALSYALTLLEKEKCEFTILNAFEVPKSHTVNVILYNDMLREKSNKQLSLWKSKIKDSKMLTENHSIKSISVLGNPTNVICRKVKEDGIDLVFMGKRGESNFEKKQIGSNAKDVIKKINCPLVLVPSNTSNKDPQHVLLISFLKDKFDKKVIESVNNVLKKNYPNLDILQIVENDSQKDFIENSMREKFLNTNINTNVASFQNFENEVEKMLHNRSVDLLTLPSGNNHITNQFLKQNTTQRNFSHSQLPYLFLNNS